MLISSYISKLEENHDEKHKAQKNNKKYVRLKNYAYLSSVIVVIQALMLILK